MRHSKLCISEFGFLFFLLLHVLSAYAAWGYETLLPYSNKSIVPRLSTWVTSPCLWLSVAENLAPRENSDLVNICSLEKVLMMPVSLDAAIHIQV